MKKKVNNNKSNRENAIIFSIWYFFILSVITSLYNSDMKGWYNYISYIWKTIKEDEYIYKIQFLKNIKIIFSIILIKISVLSKLKIYFHIFKKIEFSLYYNMFTFGKKRYYNIEYKNSLFQKKFYTYTIFFYKKIWIHLGKNKHPQIRLLFQDKQGNDIIACSNLTSTKNVFEEPTIKVGIQPPKEGVGGQKNIYFVKNKDICVITKSNKEEWKKIMDDLAKADDKSALNISLDDLKLKEVIQHCKEIAKTNGIKEMNYMEGHQTPSEMLKYFQDKGLILINKLPYND